MNVREHSILKDVNAGLTIANRNRFWVASLIAQGCLDFHEDEGTISLTEVGRELMYDYIQHPYFLEPTPMGDE